MSLSQSDSPSHIHDHVVTNAHAHPETTRTSRLDKTAQGKHPPPPPPKSKFHTSLPGPRSPLSSLLRSNSSSSSKVGAPKPNTIPRERHKGRNTRPTGRTCGDIVQADKSLRLPIARQKCSNNTVPRPAFRRSKRKSLACCCAKAGDF